MKTLDEVIAIMDGIDQTCTCCAYQHDCDETECVEKTALHYLKEYRSDMQMYAENQKYWEDELKQKIKDFGDAKERYIKRLKELDIGTLNNPLSWQELRQMEGKPVWVEEENQPSQWYLIDEVETDEDDDPEFVSMNVYDCQGYYWFYKNNIGTKWQAYRKERERTDDRK